MSVRLLTGYKVSGLCFEDIKHDNQDFHCLKLTLTNPAIKEPTIVTVAIDSRRYCCEEYSVFLISPNGYLADSNPKDPDNHCITIQPDSDPQHVCIDVDLYTTNFAAQDLFNKPLRDIRIGQDRILPQFNNKEILGIYEHVATLDFKTSVLTVVLTLQDGSEAQIVAYNNHNGFYSHDAFVTYDNYELFTSL